MRRSTFREELVDLQARTFTKRDTDAAKVARCVAALKAEPELSTEQLRSRFGLSAVTVRSCRRLAKET